MISPFKMVNIFSPGLRKSTPLHATTCCLTWRGGLSLLPIEHMSPTHHPYLLWNHRIPRVHLALTILHTLGCPLVDHNTPFNSQRSTVVHLLNSRAVLPNFHQVPDFMHMLQFIGSGGLLMGGGIFNFSFPLYPNLLLGSRGAPQSP